VPLDEEARGCAPASCGGCARRSSSDRGLLTILASSLTAADNPRVRPSRHLIRTLQEAVKIVTQRQTTRSSSSSPG
jgi:hypothetical protein